MNIAIRARALAAVTVIGATALGGCGNDAADAQVPTIDVVVSDYSFAMPKEVTGGVVRLALDNKGGRVHIAQLVRIDAGHSSNDVVELIQASEDGTGPSSAPDWFHQTGIEFAPLGPGRRSAIVTDLAAGTYVLFCLLRTPDGPHALSGMVGSFTVTGSPKATPPVADTTLAVDDDGFTLTPMKAGRHLVALRNSGTRSHEFAFAQLHPGATFDEAGAFIQEGQVGELPAEYAGGTSAVEPGETKLVEVELAAGEWTVVDVGDEGVLTGALTVG